MKRIRAPYKIAVGFGLIALMMTYGYKFVTDAMIGGIKFTPLVPEDVNIVGVDTRKGGYKIVVHNQIAHLVLGGAGAFEAGKMSEDEPEDSGDGEKKQIPIADMLQSLKGDLKGLSKFAESLNDIKRGDDWPTDAPVWKAEDLKKAFAGDKALAAKLVHDLNVDLKGEPLDQISKSSFFNGVLLDLPVPVVVEIGGQQKTLVARVQRPYQPTFMAKLLRGLQNKNITDQTLVLNYTAAVKELHAGTQKPENVQQSLEQLINPATVKRYADNPEAILKSAVVVINDDMITGAHYVTDDLPGGKKMFRLLISLTDEGRKRLWQYSKGREGNQLLLTVNGVAIAAPRIQHELQMGEVEINRLEDESLVKDAVDTINAKKKAQP